jgi:hypothetical protein
LIDDAGLRTLCGPSGTTTDILAILYAENSAAVDAALEQMRVVIRDWVQPGNELKDLFRAISGYMQIGQYHTFGEVAAGIYAAAYRGQAGANVTPAEYRENFQFLLTRMKDKPEMFFS